MSSSIKSAALPNGALLKRFVDSGDYTDCFVTQVDFAAALDAYVEAFYTTTVFKLERAILKWLVSLPSTDIEARQIARAERENFAAWNMLERNSDQLLMMDFREQTCSWFMVSTRGKTSELFFGSAVMRNQETEEGRKMKWTFRLLLGFHKVYSRILLSAARRKLCKSNARTD